MNSTNLFMTYSAIGILFLSLLVGLVIDHVGRARRQNGTNGSE